MLPLFWPSIFFACATPRGLKNLQSFAASHKITWYCTPTGHSQRAHTSNGGLHCIKSNAISSEWHAIAIFWSNIIKNTHLLGSEYCSFAFLCPLQQLTHQPITLIPSTMPYQLIETNNRCPHQWILLDLPTKTLRWTAKFAPPTPIIRSFIRPHHIHIHAPLNVITMPNHLIECPPVFYPPRISPERCAISIKYHKYCHKNPFTSQKLPLNTLAPHLRHQILKTIHSVDKYGLGEAGRILAGLGRWRNTPRTMNNQPLFVSSKRPLLWPLQSQCAALERKKTHHATPTFSIDGIGSSGELKRGVVASIRRWC